MSKYIKKLSAWLIPTLIVFSFSECNESSTANTVPVDQDSAATTKEDKATAAPLKAIDTAEYNKLMLAMSNNDTTGKWPAKAPYPLPGAIFPYNRVIAYYGNLFSKRMGVLGEYPKDEMFKRLQVEMDKWQKADSSVNVMPALHYIATTAQGSPGKDGKHRLRMPFAQVDTILSWAKEINALVFLDIQIGHSTVKAEIPTWEKYLSMPNVHFGIDPEFSMKGGEVPGRKIGTMNAEDINDAIDYMAGLVRKNNLPPKILVVHRFTQGMVTGYERIKIVPEVQVVIDMDGFGGKVLKRSTYLRYIYREPVQFTGFKLFYKNDIKTPSGMYTPEELMKFIPKPVYIQYQ